MRSSRGPTWTRSLDHRRPWRTHRQPNGFPAGGRAAGEHHLSLHGVAKVILEALGGLCQPGLGGLYQAPAAAEVHFAAGGSPGGIPQQGPPGTAQLPDEVEGFLTRFLKPASQSLLQDLAHTTGPVQLFLGGASIKHLPTVRLAPQLDVQEIVFLEGELELGAVPTQKLDQLLAREQMPVLADHRDVKPPELIGTQQALGGKAHGGAQGQHVGFAGPQHPGDPGGVSQLPVPPHQLENTIGEMRLRNGLERGSGRFAGAAAAEAESQRTQVKKFPAVHGLPFRASRGCSPFFGASGSFSRKA